jgi:proliferating cell nuclear antigen
MAASASASSPRYCLELQTIQSVPFKILIEAFKELLSDTIMVFDESGLQIIATDATHVALVHLRLDGSKFETYTCPQSLAVGVNMLNLHKLIKTVNNGDRLTLCIEASDRNHMSIKIENPENNNKTTYKLNLLDMDNDTIVVPPAVFTTIVALPSNEFQKICRDMNQLADFVEIKSIDKQLIFSCQGDFCSQETVLAGDSAVDASASKVVSSGTEVAEVAEGAEGAEGGALPATAGNEIVQGVFNIKFLVTFTKCTGLCPVVELYLRNDYPLVVRYMVGNLGDVKLCIAPQH